MDSGILWVWILPPTLIATGMLGWWAVDRLSRGRDRDEATRRAFRSAPVRHVGDVRDGQTVIVTGHVRCQEPIEAFSSRRQCAYYELVEVVNDEPDGVWVERARSHSGVDFALHDDTGEALILVEGAEVLLMKDHEVKRDLGAGSVARREGIVANEDRVAVVATARHEPDPRPSRAGGYRDSPTVLVLRGTLRRPLCITNSPALLESITRSAAALKS